MKASLGQVFAAVRAGDTALVGEVAGYIVLGAADRAIHELVGCDWGTVLINETGEIILQGAQGDALEIERDLRSMLGWLLDEVRTPFPNLRRVAERGETRGLRSLVTELETALVPVNRRAAARSLSRLCREALKSAAARARAGAELPQTQSVRGVVRQQVDSVLVEHISPVVERDRRSERVEAGPVATAPETTAPDSEDEEPTLVRSSYSEMPPAPEEHLALPPENSILPPPRPDDVELEFDVEFEDFEEFELSQVAPEPVGFSAEVERPSVAPGSSRYRSLVPGAESYSPLIWDSPHPEPVPSDISSLLSALRRDSLPSDQLYHALSLLSDGEGARASESVVAGQGS